MDIEQLVKDTFADHEHLAPHQHAVLADVRARTVAHTRHHRPSGRNRYLAVAASVAVVAGAATGAALLAGRDDPAPAAQPAHRTATASAPHPAASRRHAPAAPAIAALTMPYDLGWLPGGKIDYTARRINVGGMNEHSKPSFDGEYMLTAHVAGQSVDIDVQEFPGGLGRPMSKCSAMTATRIAGRPAYQTADASGACGYELYFRDAGARTMYVNVMRSKGQANPAARMRAIGRRVAENVRYPGTANVRPGFGVGYVPKGAHVRAFDVEHTGSPLGGPGETTSYDLGTTAAQDPVATVGTNSVVSKGAPGRAVQGHPTRYVDDHGYRQLAVDGAVGKETVVIASNHLPKAQLYKIADGLVLPH